MPTFVTSAGPGDDASDNLNVPEPEVPWLTRTQHEATFGRVYRAVQDGSLDERNWSCVSHLLPKASWWREWDRCERLRLGIVDRFLSRQWSEARLFDLIGDDRVSGDLVAEFGESRDGRRFLRRVTRAIEDGTLSIPTNYRGPRKLRW